MDNPFLSSFRFHFFQLEEDNDNDNDNDNDDDDDNDIGNDIDNFNDNKCQNYRDQNTLVEESKLIPMEMVKNLLKQFGATISDSIDLSTTHVVTQFECEHLLPTQLLGPVEFVTLSWILKILSNGRYSAPCESIDFPCPIHPIPESKLLVRDESFHFFNFISFPS